MVAATIVASFLYKQRFDGIFACGAAGYRPGTYLSDCAAPGYGDYDHGAFWYELEATARDAARSADVLFLGNSRLQFAMSTTATREWFDAASIRHYLLGFSHSETTVFTGPLIQRIGVRPRVVVINVDRFFEDRASPPMEQIRSVRDVESRYWEKRTWQTLHRRFCGALPAACGDATAVFREQATGAWHLTGRVPGKASDVSDASPAAQDRWTTYAALAEQFVSRLSIDRRCVVLTLVPTVASKRAEAEAIAKALDMPLIRPELDGLRTFDGSHLDASSAARWSAAFLEAAGSRIRRCTSMNGPRP